LPDFSHRKNSDGATRRFAFLLLWPLLEATRLAASGRHDFSCGVLRNHLRLIACVDRSQILPDHSTASQNGQRENFTKGETMESDDQNYRVMQDKQVEYIAHMKREAKANGVEISQWELEEIEMAFEHGFAHGFVAGYQSLREVAREGVH
jgi:hypothetical protein